MHEVINVVVIALIIVSICNAIAMLIFAYSDELFRLALKVDLYFKRLYNKL